MTVSLPCPAVLTAHPEALSAIREADCHLAVWQRTAIPELAALLDYARRGDVLMVWRLDRLGRSLPHLLAVASDLQDRGVELRSLTEVIDTTTPGGRLIFHVFGAVAEFERAIAAERTAAGVAAARAAGRHPGRPGLTADTIAAAQALDQAGTPRAQIARTLGISRSSVYRSLVTPSENHLPGSGTDQRGSVVG